jgi:hypothetical protein
MPDPADTDPAAPRFSGSGSSRSFGRYLLLGTIARGGMGEIHLALAGSIAHAQKLCVVKTIRAEFTGEDNLVARFLDEGRVLCALQHPNIGQVMEVAIEQGVPFLAMEYVGGTDLAELIDAGRGSRRYPPLDVVLSCLAAVLDGMAYAHRAQGLDGTPFHLVHRDPLPREHARLLGRRREGARLRHRPRRRTQRADRPRRHLRQARVHVPGAGAPRAPRPRAPTSTPSASWPGSSSPCATG